MVSADTAAGHSGTAGLPGRLAARYGSVLYQPRSDTPVPEPARDGEDPVAGFTCRRGVPQAPRQR